MKMSKRFMAILLAIVCCFTMSVTAFASNSGEIKEVQECSTSENSIQPYADQLLGTATTPINPEMGTKWHYYQQTKKATGLIKRYKAIMTTSGFKSSTTVTVTIYNSNGVSVMSQVLSIQGNGTAQALLNPVSYINGDTVKVEWNVITSNGTSGDTGKLTVSIYSY